MQTKNINSFYLSIWLVIILTLLKTQKKYFVFLNGTRKCCKGITLLLYVFKQSTESVQKFEMRAFFRFRTKKSNCIVATDVVDEGIDIPTCTLVIRFDLPMDFRSYIQSKGRARHISSQYTMIVSSDDDKFRRKLVQFQETERFIQGVYFIAHFLISKERYLIWCMCIVTEVKGSIF